MRIWKTQPHGKTTTSGLASFVLEKAGYKPSYVVGGIIPELHTNANCSDKQYNCQFKA